MDTTFNSSVIRTDVWANEIKDILQEELIGDRLVRWISEFPEGDTLHIPTLSELNVRDYEEGQEVVLDDANTGEFTLSIDKYYQSGFIVYDKFKQDSFYVNELVSNFVGKLTRALMEKKEIDVLALQGKQTAANSNTINGAAHRMLASGTNEAITLKDIAKAKFALDKANVSKVGRVAVVDPAVSYQLVNIDNVIRQDVYGANANIKEGLSGTIYLGRYMGFDFFESNLLDTYAAATNIDGSSSTNAGAYNLFLGQDAFVGAMRAMPEIENWRVHEKKGDAYHATVRYGIDLYRPEALVVIGANNSAV
jgi:hypothetical protein